jgi:hypothetical protein
MDVHGDTVVDLCTVWLAMQQASKKNNHIKKVTSVVVRRRLFCIFDVDKPFEVIVKRESSESLIFPQLNFSWRTVTRVADPSKITLALTSLDGLIKTM